MELKVYQQNALDAFRLWLEALEEARNNSEKAIQALKQAGVDSIPDELQNYPQKAWQNLKQNGDVAPTAGDYVTRTDDAKRPIPHVCFKVPTGGGKTLLAAAALERLHRQRGLTLWIVPTKAIYAQTKTALWNKEHPYRKMLERASAGSVKMLEKDDPFNRDDIANYLCVMLLMLPAANRQKGKEFLRMFKDTGKYPSFFPDGDDIFGDARMRNEYPDLECKSEREGGVVKQSLFNVFKMLRPVIVLDEAHKAYGASRQKANEEFARSINRLDPRMIIELSATPNRGISNLLVDIDGTALKKEEMIKLPVQVKSNSRKNAETTSWRDDWQYTLQQAVDELQRLNDAAEALENTTNRYIRPIAVVRVERTGKDQRDGERIHAEDVREYLTRLGVSPEAIRVKSSENDELQNEDLLSEMSQVRWIITKSALMEGWDCPFAYLLVMLDNTQAQKAITQLVGRVMRQPHAQLTGQKALDQCYVYCNNTDVGIAVEQVKNGLESEGLTGLGDEVVGATGIQEIEDFRTQTVKRRSQFRDQAIYLPVVLHRNEDAWIQLNYQSHILPHIKWSAIQAPTPNASASDSMIWQSATVDVGEAPPVYHPDQEPYVDKTVDISDFARRLSDLLPNPWRAACIASQMRESLRQSGKTEEDIYDRRSYLVHALREHVKHEIEQQAERIFRRKLDHGEIRFDLETEEPNYKLRYQYEIEVRANDRPLTRYGNPVQLSLFEPVFEQHFDSDLEQKFAYSLDERRALPWWHRIAVRQSGEYDGQGWKQGRIYPDVGAMTREIAGVTRVLMFEAKGEHLGGNLDTEYKKKVLKTLEDTFNNAGTMCVREGTTREGIFQLVFSEQAFPEITVRLGEQNFTEMDK